MPIRIIRRRGSLSHIIPIEWLTWWTCGSTICWMYRSMQNTMIIIDTFFSVIDVFSKFWHMVPIKTKSGPSVALGFRSIFNESKYSTRRPLWVSTDKGQEILNKHFQNLLRWESGGIQFQVCRYPELKFAAVDRVHRTIRDRIDKYFSHKNTYRYIVVLPNLKMLTMTRFTRRLAWRPHESPIETCLRYERECRPGEGAFASRKKRRFVWGNTSASAKKKCGLPRLPNRILAPRFSGREGNWEAAVSRLWTRGFKWHTYRRPVLSRGTDPPYE